MLHIILMILKILGILILSILGLGLCIGLLILLCPIRYYLEGSIYGKPEGKVRISWLLHLVCATVSYKENRAECKICILGIRLRKPKKKEVQEDSENIEEEKKKFHFFKKRKKDQNIEKKKIEKKKTEKEKIEKEGKGDPAEGIDENLEAKKTQQTGIEKKEQTNTQQIETEKKDQIKIQQAETEKKEEINVQQVESEKKIEQSVQKEEIYKSELNNPDKVSEVFKKDVIEEVIQKESSEKKRQLFLESVIAKIREGLTKVKDTLIKIKDILIKIKGVPVKIKGIFTKIKDILLAIKANIQKFLVFLRNINKKKQIILEFIKDEKNKEAFRYTKGKLFRILCHVLPGRVTLRLHYGFEDPATTGMLTGMIFMLYPKSAERFQLMPDFEKRVLEGELTIKGRVQLIRVLWNLFSIYSHKECKRIIKMVLKKLKMR